MDSALLTLLISIIALLSTRIEVIASLKCYQCQKPSGDCIDNQCTGSWCVAIITEDNSAGVHKIEKMCAQSNPANVAVDMCSKETVGTAMTTRCGCQLEDFCNSEAGLARLMGDKNAGLGQPQVGSIPINVGGSQPTGNTQFGANPSQSNFAGGPQPGNGSPLTPLQRPSFVLNTGPGGVDPNNNFNNQTNPLVPRFPPTAGGNQFPTPDNPANSFGAPVVPNGNGQQPPLQPSPGNGRQGQNQPQGGPFINNNINSATSTSEPEPGSKNLTSANPSLGQSGDAQNRGGSGGTIYACHCQGPAYCENGECRDEFCSRIEVDTRDISHQAPVAPNNPHQPPTNQQDQQPTIKVYRGCMKSSGLAGATLTTNKIYPRLAYQLVVDGKVTKVNSNQQFCAGDYCNFATAAGKLSSFVLVSCLFFMLFH